MPFTSCTVRHRRARRLGHQIRHRTAACVSSGALKAFPCRTLQRPFDLAGRGRAEAGQTYKQILEHYFNGAQVARIY